MPDLCSLQCLRLWSASSQNLPNTVPCCICPLLLFCWQVIISPMVGSLPTVHCQRQPDVCSKHGINMQMEERKKVGLGRREFKVVGQTLLRLDWGAVNQWQPLGQRYTTKRTKMGDKESPYSPPTYSTSSFLGAAGTPRN